MYRIYIGRGSKRRHLPKMHLHHLLGREVLVRGFYGPDAEGTVESISTEFRGPTYITTSDGRTTDLAADNIAITLKG